MEINGILLQQWNTVNYFMLNKFLVYECMYDGMCVYFMYRNRISLFLYNDSFFGSVDISAELK